MQQEYIDWIRSRPRSSLAEQYTFECWIDSVLSPGKCYYPSSCGASMAPYRIFSVFPKIPDDAIWTLQACGDTDGPWIDITTNELWSITGECLGGYNGPIFAKWVRIKIELKTAGHVRIDVGRGYSLKEIWAEDKMAELEGIIS